MTFNFFKKIDERTQGQWFVTGSRAFGVHDENSDLDICVPINIDPDSLMEGMTELFARSEYSNGSKYKPIPRLLESNDVVINVIPLHPKEFLSWAVATTMIQRALTKSSNHLIKDKEKRVIVFELLKTQAKLILNGVVGLEDINKFTEFFQTLERDAFLAYGDIQEVTKADYDDIPF